jgi:hypothetical protein
MITPNEIHQKTLKLWESGRILSNFLEKETLFPWVINFRKPTAQQQLDDFTIIRDWINHLKKRSNESGAVSYSIDYKTYNHRQLGLQQLPVQIVFNGRDDYLRYLGKQGEFKSLLKTYHQSCARYPKLHDWIVEKPRLFMKYQSIWSKLLSVCDYFIANPRPNCYLRELEITSVDSKFIEKNTAILTLLLDLLLPESSIKSAVTGSKQHGFERRYDLKYDEAVIRLRLLDENLKPAPALSDISLPLSQLCEWEIDCWRVFITENKVNGLSFPQTQDSMVIFGLGYGVDTLAEIPWLSNCEIYYWGDIDTHGLSILSRLRRYFPKVHALMMDEKTLSQHDSLCTEEPPNACCKNKLNYLTESEQKLYQKLQSSHQRLEQERIPISYVKNRIKRC